MAEIKAAVAATPACPPEVPLAGGTQALAHRLVTAALLLFTAAAGAAPAVTSHGPPRPAHSVSAADRGPPGHRPLAGPEAGLAGLTAPTAGRRTHAAPHSEKIYMVKPPAGRFHESLWEIAENHLGDGRRYREIFELNKDRVQPDGSKLTIASLIRPGWVLHMPEDAHGPGIEAVTASRPGAGLSPAGGTAAPPRRRAPARGEAGPAAPGLPASCRTGQATRPAGPAPSAGPGPTSPPADPAGRQARPWPSALRPRARCPRRPRRAAVAARRAVRRLAAGRRVLRRSAGGAGSSCGGGPSAGGSPRPTGTRRWPRRRCGWARTSRAVRMLDTGLRYLSVSAGRPGKTPPTVFAAHLGEENLDLWVAPADPNPPAPVAGGRRRPGLAAAAARP